MRTMTTDARASKDYLPKTMFVAFENTLDYVEQFNKDVKEELLSDNFTSTLHQHRVGS